MTKESRKELITFLESINCTKYTFLDEQSMPELVLKKINGVWQDVTEQELLKIELENAKKEVQNLEEK